MFNIIRPVAVVAQRPIIVVKLSRGRSAGLSVRTYVRRSFGRSVCPVLCGKTVDRIGRTGPVMRQVVGFGDRSTWRGTFAGEFGARHCNQWGLYATLGKLVLCTGYIGLSYRIVSNFRRNVVPQCISLQIYAAGATLFSKHFCKKG